MQARHNLGKMSTMPTSPSLRKPCHWLMPSMRKMLARYRQSHTMRNQYFCTCYACQGRIHTCRRYYCARLSSIAATRHRFMVCVTLNYTQQAQIRAAHDSNITMPCSGRTCAALGVTYCTTPAMRPSGMRLTWECRASLLRGADIKHSQRRGPP